MDIADNPAAWVAEMRERQRGVLTTASAVMPRSIVDAASWMRTENGTRAVLAAGVQQRLVLPDALSATMAHRKRAPRQALISATLGDIRGGAQALSELDFCRLTPHPPPHPPSLAARAEPPGVPQG